MSVDLLGPAIAAGGVTVRPGETRAFGVSDTFFRDCTDAATDDGTAYEAAFFNAVLANIRSTIRGNGNLTAGGTPVVAEDNAADDLVLKAIQYMIQRGQPQFADDTGSQNHVVVALTPAPPELKKGMTIIAKINAANTGATDLNVNGSGAVAVKRVDGTDLVQGDLIAGAMAAFSYDGTKWQLVWRSGAQLVLQAPTTYYVNAATGNDAYDGTASAWAGGASTVGPWQTLQHAQDVIVKYNLNGFDITINVANGTYTNLSLRNMSGSGNVLWVGNAAAPANVLLSSVNRTAIVGTDCGKSHSLNGFKVQSSNGGAPVDGMGGVNVTGASVLGLQNMEYGTCVGFSVLATGGGARIRLGGTQKVSGSSQGFMAVSLNGVLDAYSISPPDIAFSFPAAISFGTAFAYATQGGQLQVPYASMTGAANVTGTRYRADYTGVILVSGGGANYYPGTGAGTTNGGQYA